MSFGRAWSPTLGQRKSPLGGRQALQRKPEETRLSPRATSCASHSFCAAGPACTPAAAFGPAEPSHPRLPAPLGDLSPSAPMAPARPTRSRSGALCRQLLLALTVSGRPAAGSRKGAPPVGGARGNSGSRSGWGWRAKRRLMCRRPVE